MRAGLFWATCVSICISLACVGETFGNVLLILPRFDAAQVGPALVAPVVFAAICFWILQRSEFSFGYVVAFYFFWIVFGFLCLAPFSRLQYDHPLAIASAFISGLMIVFLASNGTRELPRFEIPVAVAKRLPDVFLLISAGAVIAAACYNFRLIAVTDIYRFRTDLEFPAPIRYANGIVLSALLPLAFASYVELKRPVMACAALALMLALYPITLTKFALLAPFWLAFLFGLSRLFEARCAVIVSILFPVTLGLVALVVESSAHRSVYQVFGLINFRLAAIPSISLDVYNAFFANHAPTHFCQVGFIRAIVGCAYDPQLGVEIAQAYPLGNFNASMLSTEGVASVGVKWAPVSALICGTIIAVASSMAARLPPRFVLLSSAMAVQQFINIPLTTALLSHGAGLLFLIWYLTPKRALIPATPGEA
ncbi:hypothetical protein [Bradyrhizobium genosp. A]|uniref:hypothetical protein n=1 Tax=Bradyrhizobium genosp. A TaxID=83626 RepID=UPI003CE7CA8A